MSYQNYTDTLQGVRKGAGYLAQVREKFPHAVLEEEWQTANQLTITIKTEMLPEVVEFLYYGCGGWLPVLWGNDERPLNGQFAVYYALSM
ncbi:hydrogenase large subunit, partial [Escherichia coli]